MIFFFTFSTWVQKTLLSHRENSVNLLITKQIFCLVIYHIETYMINKDSFHFNLGMIQNQDFFSDVWKSPKPTLQKDPHPHTSATFSGRVEKDEFIVNPGTHIYIYIYMSYRFLCEKIAVFPMRKERYFPIM